MSKSKVNIFTPGKELDEVFKKATKEKFNLSILMFHSHSLFLNSEELNVLLTTLLN